MKYLYVLIYSLIPWGIAWISGANYGDIGRNPITGLLTLISLFIGLYAYLYFITMENY